jgi:hypothetical protein
MIGDLSVSDRGNLGEVWFAARHAPDALTQQTYQVIRTSGEHEGQLETRRADAIQGRKLYEIKYLHGEMDKKQLGAVMDRIKDDSLREATGVDQLQIVFLNPEGAIENLAYLATQFGEAKLRHKMTIEVFDNQGTRHTAINKEQALGLLNTLRGK